MYQFFQSLGQNLLNGIITAFQWLGNLFSNLWSSFTSFLSQLFQTVILFFQGIWYLLTKVFDIVVLVVQVLFGLFKVVWGVVGGIFHTFAQLMGFSGSTDYYYMPHAYQQGFSGVTGFLGQTGFNTIALIATAFIWMLTAYAIIKIAGGER